MRQHSRLRRDRDFQFYVRDHLETFETNTTSLLLRSLSVCLTSVTCVHFSQVVGFWGGATYLYNVTAQGLAVWMPKIVKVLPAGVPRHRGR